MKRIYLVLVLVIGFLAVCIYCVEVNSACAADTEAAFTPFLGKWEGAWSFTYANAPTTRPCKLVVYLDKGQGYVDYHLGAIQTSGAASKRNMINNVDEKNKLQAEIKDIKGVSYLIFSPAQGKNIHWFLKNGQLISESTSAGNDYKCALSKAK